MTKILVTGCLGFIGAHFVKYVLDNTDFSVIGFNRNSDQRNAMRLPRLCDIHGRYYDRFNLVFGDLCYGRAVHHRGGYKS